MRLRIEAVCAQDLPAACKVVIASEDVQSTHYIEGNCEIALPKGQYEITLRKGKLYAPVCFNLTADTEDVTLHAVLLPLIDAPAMGLYAFDAHSHVSRDANSTQGDLSYASTVMKAEGFHFFFAGSPYDPDVHQQYLRRHFTDTGTYRQKYAQTIEKVSDGCFTLDIGNELVKCRYGHYFLLNYDQRPPFSQHYDEAFDPWLFTKIGEEPKYVLAPPYQALAESRGHQSVAVAAHPTSWWYHHNGQFITNIAATLGFDVWCGTIDAMVVLGYHAANLSYQALWLHLLDLGIRMSGIAETDVAFDNMEKLSQMTMFKTYTACEEMSIDSLCEGIRAGRNMATSGPLLTLKVDGQSPGAVLPYLHKPYAVDIEALPCCEGPITRLEMIVNGQTQAFPPAQTRHYVTLPAEGYILARCWDSAGNQAVCNPIYIRNTPFSNEGYRATVHAVCEQDTDMGTFRLEDGAETPFVGGFTLQMPPTATLTITRGERCDVIRLFKLDSLQAIFRNLYFGWFNNAHQYQPGVVPPEAFAVETIRHILDDVQVVLRS